MQDKELRIKVILLEVDARSYLEKGIEEELKKYGSFQIELDYMTIPYSETEKQVRALRSCIGEKVQGVILSPINSPEIVKEIDACTLVGIPVVTVNTDIKGSQRLCFIGQDGFKAVGDVLEEYEREDIKLICYENYPEIIELLKKDIVTATLDSDIEEQGKKALEVLMDYLIYDRMPVQKHLYSEIKIMLKESI